ncbi:hypothetical protein HanIR_Chr15g0731311 [Helianthus annuus]|nr:hypothetical protein HanIR_Chr15g0731311 [Helianthus annuus]
MNPSNCGVNSYNPHLNRHPDPPHPFYSADFPPLGLHILESGPKPPHLHALHTRNLDSGLQSHTIQSSGGVGDVVVPQSTSKIDNRVMVDLNLDDFARQ